MAKRKEKSQKTTRKERGKPVPKYELNMDYIKARSETRALTEGEIFQKAMEGLKK